jgi:hypothetical protein
MKSWFQGTPRRPRRQPRLAVEMLEDRVVPATFTVNSLADLSIAAGVNPATGAINGLGNTVTLRSAIDAANHIPGGNTILLALPGTYKIALPGANTGTDASGAFAILPSGGNLTILNASGGAVTVDGNHLDRVFDINPTFDFANPTPAFTVTMQGFTITGGVASPGDAAAGSGGGIRDIGNASLTLNNMVVTGNVATADGGGIVMENTVSTPWKLTVNNSTISNNHAGDAGGGIDTDGSGKVFLNAGTVITGNTCVNQGAGIWLDAIQVGVVFQTANLSVTGTVISANQALNGPGGGIGNAGLGTVTIITSTITNNFSGMMGGGFGDENNQGSLVVVNSLFLNNVAVGDGGAIAESGPTTSITGSLIVGNASGARGGAVFAAGTTLFVQNSTIANNTAAGDAGTSQGGGGIELETTGTGLQASSITNSTITGNRALNSAGVFGGGIDAFSLGGDLQLLNDTINANFAAVGGGIIWEQITGSISVQNTILAGNISPLGVDALNATRAYTDLGGNLIGVAGDFNSGFTAASTQTGSLANPLNPRLAPLASNGGPAVGAPGNTQVLQTEALQTGSPAIGQGNPFRAPAFDERGFMNLVGGAMNVGAVSAVVPPPAPLPTHVTTTLPLVSQQTVNGVLTTTYNVNSTADTHTPAAGTLTLRAALDMANAATGNKIIRLLVAGDYAITLPGANTGTNASGAFVILPSGGNVTILNASGGVATVDGNHLDRVFDINPAADVNFNDEFTVTLQGITIANGIAQPGDGAAGSGGGIRAQGIASLTLNNVIVTGNLATADGGGISMENTASSHWVLTVNNSTISFNHAGDAGGGIETDGSSKVLLNAGTVITGNTCVNQGAGVWLDAIAVTAPQGTVGSVTITNPGTATFGPLLGFPTVVFTSVDGKGSGAQGSLVVDANGVPIGVTITNPGSGYDLPPTISFTFPFFTPDITAVATLTQLQQGASLTVTGAVISNNDALDMLGGGIGNAGNGAVTILGSTVENNLSGGTGGGFADSNNQGTLTVTNSLFLKNVAVGAGGGIREGGPTTTLTRTALAGNVSGATGGGLFADGGTLSVQGCTFTGNTASGDPNTGEGGGAIEVQTTGASSIIDSTIAFNRAVNNAGVNGGGIDAQALAARLLVLNDTINGNYAAAGGGIFWGGMTGSSVAVENTLLALNLAASGVDAFSPTGSAFTDLGGNLIGVAGDANTGFTAATTQSGSLANPLNPRLGPLGFNGGPTVGARGASLPLQTEALAKGSPALGKGIKTGAPLSDERGVANGPVISIGAVNV